MARSRVGMAADVSVLAMTADLGAEIRGVDLAAPLSDACFQRILEAFHRYCVVFVRRQRLDPRLLMRFASRFGELATPSDDRPTIPGLPQIGLIADPKDYPRAARHSRYGFHWRTDGPQLQHPPAVTILHAVECPVRGAGGMEFANLQAAYAALPRTQRLFVERLRGIYHGGARLGARQATPASGATEHPLVRIHPVTGMKTLYAGKDIVSRILGLTPDESRVLLDELETFATQPRFIYSHAFAQGDVLLWDNRCLLHRPTVIADAGDRVLHRVQVRGEIPLSASSA